MTDTASSLQAPRALRRAIPPDEAAARVKRRYASERLFKRLGFGALAVTAVFLVTLLTAIIVKSLPAFTEHRAVLDVLVDASIVDPDGKRDPNVLRAADYGSLTRTAIAAAIPGIEGRTPRKALNGLISSGAGDDVRTQVLANPNIIGTTIKTPLLFSADVDLYLKDDAIRQTTLPGAFDLTPSGLNGEITLTAVQPDAFSQLIKDLEQAGVARDADAGAHVLTPRDASRMISLNGGMVKIEKVTPTTVTGPALLPLTSVDTAKANAWAQLIYEQPESRRRVTDQEAVFIDKLKSSGAIERGFNFRFFTSGDSREPELAGIKGALFGTALTLLVTLALCLPIGVLAAIYLEEFAPKNRLTDIIEVNINNLAAVPSIVFGLLGLAVFLNYFNLPRSAPLVGGLVLALLVLPTIIIAARAAIKAVPPSIREAAIGLGASQQQAVFHHVLPLAMPGIMTGTIIGMAHALGETAPLLMIGMVAFIVDVPSTVTDAATVLPVQIYLWSDLPEAAFQQRTAAAIVVLLGFLFAMNGAAIWLRNKFERRW